LRASYRPIVDALRPIRQPADVSRHRRHRRQTLANPLIHTVCLKLQMMDIR
jgi:hypothetical protein